MRVLIIGEFSSFSKNLSIGLRMLGHETFVFSWGDGFKKITQDNSYLINVGEVPKDIKTNVISRIKYTANLFREKCKLNKFVRTMSKRPKFDVILLVNPTFIKYGLKFWHPLLTKKMVLNLVNDPNQIYLSACGSDVPFYYYWLNNKSKNFNLVNKHANHYLSDYHIKKLSYLGSFIHKVIPVMYDYSQAWKNCPLVKDWLVLSTIPLPIDLSGIDMYNVIGDKIFIYHGIIRPFEKGTPYIVEAMKRIEEEYPDRVECLSKGGLPLDDYKKVLAKTNISIDQVYSFSIGMNGLYSLAMGKVLLSGNEFENVKEFCYEDIPVMNITPSSDQIYGQLKFLIENPNVILELSKKSRKYVEEVHEAKLVAQKYVDLFEAYKSK